MSADVSPSPPRAGLPAARAPGRRWVTAVQGAVALLLLAAGAGISIQGADETNLRLHHLEHAAFLCGGGLLGILLGVWLRMSGRVSPLGLLGPLVGISLVGPVAAMAAMIPATSSRIDQHPPLHALEHLGFIVLGGIIGASGALIGTAIGWVDVLVLAAMACGFAGMARA